MKNPVHKKFDMVETDLDDLDKFEFEEQDNLREFFENYDVSETKDLLL